MQINLSIQSQLSKVDREARVIYGVSLAQMGEATGHRIELDSTTINQIVELANKGNGVKCRWNHTTDMGNLIGRIKNVRREGDKAIGDLHISPTALQSPNGNLGDYVLSLAENEPDMFGLSVDISHKRVWIKPDGSEISASQPRPANAINQLPVIRVTRLIACDVVDDPAANHGLFNALPENQDMETEEVTQPVTQAQPAAQSQLAAQPDAWSQALARSAATQLIALSGLPAASRQRLAAASYSTPDDVETAIEAERQYIAKLSQDKTVHGLRPVTAGDMQDERDKLQSGLEWMLGVPDSKTPAANLRNITDLYLAITGDYEFHGIFDSERSQLASATTTTLPGMAANALNKAVYMHYQNMETWKWFEQIVAVVAHDNTTQPIQMIVVDGVGNLPTVNEGQAYEEASVGDSKESMTFSKRGRYVGITMEMIRRSQIARIQAIPMVLATASIRSRSAAIAGIFTAASGVGPTLADDSTVLFHSNHANISTVAFSAAEWAVQRKKIYSQTVPGTSNKFGLWPKFALFPIDLYDSALEVFGYGAAGTAVGRPSAAGTAQVANPYGESRMGDPRPIPLVVPEWTDANDWATIADPKLQPVIQMAYANQPQGGGHPMPEIYSATGETNGLIFTNDTLPVKIRDWFSYGVATYVGVGKSNVA